MEHTPEPSMLCDCGCELINHGSELGLEILYCSLHDAAPQLLEACKGLVKASTTPHEHIEQCPADLGEAECICGFHTALDAAHTAIAAATTTESDETLEANRHLLRGDTDWEERI